MTTFYLIRHGKTELNLKDCFQGGGIDSPLLAESVEQALQLGSFLADVSFDAVGVSTQKRAIDTAHYIIKENNFLNRLPLCYFDELREISFGEREGQVIDRSETETYHLQQRPDLYSPSAFGGEEIDAAVLRGKKVLEELAKQHPEGKVLIVAHGTLLILLINSLLKKDKSEWRKGGPLANTSVSILQADFQQQQFELKLFNDTSYQKDK